MSDATFEALEQAVNAHLLTDREDAGVVTQWLLIGVSQGANPSRSMYHYVSPEDVSPHATTGLMVHMTDKMRMHMVGGQDDDD